MLHEWRLLDDGIHEARHHFAMEESLARLVDEGHSPPTLRLRQVYPAVFVGVFQNTWSEVDVAYCKANDIQIVRRANGGGAVYHEMGSFCFSAFFKRDFFPQSDDELYHLFAKPVIQTCADYGVTANYRGRNDVLVGERKIYGSAQLSWYNTFVQSGTFLVTISFDKMERALTPPALKFNGKSARSIHERVTSLSQLVGSEIDPRQVMERFVVHTAEVLNIHLTPGELTLKEKGLAAELFDCKYSTEEWNLGSRPEYQVVVADRSEAGVISLSADMIGEKIQNIRLNSDLLLTDRNVVENLEHSLMGCSLRDARAVVQYTKIPDVIKKSLFCLLDKLTQEVNTVSSQRSKENLR